MANDPAADREDRFRDRMLHRVKTKEERKRKARREGERSVWFGLGMFGLVGWSVAIPTLIVIALGVWLDTLRNDRYSWTLMFLIAGVVVGCLIAGYWVRRESRGE
jgi:ATP synthase protein I